METLFINIGTQEKILMLIMSIAALAPLILAIIALIDLFKRDFGEKTTDKILLIVLILFAPFIGSLVYLLALRNNYRLREHTEKISI